MNAARTALAFGLAFVLGGVASAQVTTRVSVDSLGAEGNDISQVPAVSADGLCVAFQSYASNLVAGDTNGHVDIFVNDRTTGITELVSVDSSGAQGNAGSYQPTISSDGRFVAFSSYASNLVPGDTNGLYDVFVHDRTTSTTERVSIDSSGVEGNNNSFISAFGRSISGDGRFVVLWSDASNLVVGDTNGLTDVFVHDRTDGSTERVSIDSNGSQGNDSSGDGSISADGGYVAFVSFASNLISGDTNGAFDIFFHDRTTGVTERVSVSSGGLEANSDSYFPAISSDGNVVAFGSAASNLIAADANGSLDVFVHDQATGITERVSVDSSGGEANGNSYSSSISADGETIAIESDASNLVAADTNACTDIFVHDRVTGQTERASVDSSGAEGNAASFNPPSISADGKKVVFESDASNLVVGDTNGFSDVFLHARCDIDASWSNYGAGFSGTIGVPGFVAQSNPVLGASLTLDLANSYGRFTAGLLFVGFQQTSIHSGWGGDLVVVPFLTIAIGIPSGGASFSGTIPDDETLCGFEIDLQAIEADPGAAKGVSFTQGLELVLGR